MSTTDPRLAADLARLLDMFPDADEAYLAQCLAHYDADAESTRVGRVAHKIVELNHGYYPRVVRTQHDIATAAGASSSSSAVKPPTNATLSWRRTTKLGATVTTPPPSAAAMSTASKNMYLTVLAELFPAVDAGYLREKIEANPANTVVCVAKALLRSGASRPPRRKTWGQLTAGDMFRSPEYVQGARCRLYNSFPHLWKSSIKAYLAENQFDFVATYLHLQTLPATSNFFFDLFKRGEAADPAMYDHDLLRDLDRLDSLVHAAQVDSDRALAQSLNRAEYAAEGQAVECGCCYADDVAWEDVAACAAGHLVCRACLARVANDVVFGEAAAAYLDPVGGSGIRCFHADGGCEAGYPDDAVRAALEEPAARDGDPKATTPRHATPYALYTHLVARTAAAHAGFEVHACPFCGSFEVADPPPPATSVAGAAVRLGALVDWPRLAALARDAFRLLAHAAHRLNPFSLAVPGLDHDDGRGPDGDRFPLLMRLVVAVLGAQVVAAWVGAGEGVVAGVLGAAVYWLAVMGLDFAYVPEYMRRGPEHHSGATDAAAGPLAVIEELPSRVAVRRCRSPACGRSVCLECRAEYLPLHRCHEAADESLPQAVEHAMSQAVKRVCPACFLPFTKSDGCNLMTCTRCKYVMCYVCRRGIGKEKYKHFCGHFRLVPGPCTECTACELYAAEDERAVRRAAGTRARDEWLRGHPGTRVPRAELRQVQDLIDRA
ncbi:hypothetical protein H9P43_008826 [Blastocladiella emersonii ATCC 22665]|nr:hypothetical protein H9P43_008826 [Blastocladiella emersonii ATCC 22665]